MNPKHTNPTKPNRIARAPYNFVPLPEKVVPAETPLPDHDTYDPERYTGYLDCTLVTKSPVYTRTALNPEFFAQWADKIQEMMRNDQAREKYAEFFHLDDKQRPVIPGSSLRGMIRTLVEIVSYGKVQWVTKNKLFFRTVDNTAVGLYYRERMVDKVEGGILRLDKTMHTYYIERWNVVRVHREKLPNSLYDGKRPNLTPRWNYQYKKIWISLSGDGKYANEISFESKNNYREGILVITGDIPGKKKEFVLVKPEGAPEVVPIDEGLIWRFHDDDQITRWQRRAFPRNRPTRNSRQRDGMLRRDNLLAQEGDPVFFLRENGKVTFFGRAHLFRLPYLSSPFDLIPKAVREGSVDLAEAIFGYVGDKSYAGRVSITDAITETGQDNVWMSNNPKTPRILGSPKPTTLQHYLVQDSTQNHDPDEKDTLAYYDTPSPDETTIRGHKLYWHKGHNPNFIEQRHVNWQRDTQHTQIKPVRPGVRFRFRVYFENLSKAELGALLWVLDLPQGHYHKIGMGKPLGLGAVEIRSRLVLTDRHVRYRQLFAENTWATAKREENDLGQFKKDFEQYVLDHMDASERNDAQRLTEVERIRMLLKMLEWPGPGTKHTQYMKLKPRNEFKNRPVLRDPMHVSLSITTTSGSEFSASPHQRRAPTARSSSDSASITKLKSTEDIKPGIHVQGTIKRAEQNRFVVELGPDLEGSLPYERVKGVQPENAVDFVGVSVVVEILRINKKGRIQLRLVKWLE